MQVNRRVVTTVLGAAATYDLTDLETARDELALKTTDTSKDAFIGRGITQVSQAISRRCDRIFLPEFVNDVFYVSPDTQSYELRERPRPLQLTRWPVIAVASVTLLPSNAPAISLVQGVDYVVDQSNGWLHRLNTNLGNVDTFKRWESFAVSVIYSGGYGAQVIEPRAVPGTPFEVTVEQADDYSCDCGVSYASGAPLTAVASSPAQGQYSVDTEDGEYTFAAEDQGANVVLTYATSNVPAELVDAVLRLVTQRVSAQGRDAMLMERNQPGTLGTERFWIPQGQNGAFPPEIDGLLDPYKRVVFA